MSTNDADNQLLVEVEEILSGDPGNSPNPPPNFQPRNFKIKNKSRFGLRTTPNTAKGNSTNDPYDYEQKYKEDDYGEELAPNARVWRTYQDEADRYDREMVETWRDMLDVLLVFAGLFSAIVTTFAGQASLSLQPDNTPLVTASLIQELISLQRATGAGQNLSTVPPSSVTIGSPSQPSTSDVWVNGLWFTSLAFSLTAALLAVIVKQWIASYVSAVSGTAQQQVRVRQFRFRGLKDWHVPSIIGWLPLLLYIALFLFSIGLVIFLFKLNLIIACIVGAIGGISFMAYFGSHAASIIYPSCPYRTTLSTRFDKLFFGTINPRLYASVPRVLIRSSLRIMNIMNTSRRVTGRPPPESYYTQFETYVSDLMHDFIDWWRWSDIVRLFRSTMADSSFVRFMKAVTDRQRAEDWLDSQPPLRPYGSLGNREAFHTIKAGDEFDAEALIWLHGSPSNATARSIVLQSMSGIGRNMDQQALRLLASYFVLPPPWRTSIPVIHAADLQVSMRTVSELSRLVPLLSCLDLTAKECREALDWAVELQNPAWEIVLEAYIRGRATVHYRQGTAYILRSLSELLMSAQPPIASEEADWERFFQVATLEVVTFHSRATVNPTCSGDSLWKHVFRLLEVLPHDKPSIEAAMYQVGTNRRMLKLSTQCPGIQLSGVIVRYIQAQCYLDPTFDPVDEDVQITSAGTKHLTFLAVLRAAYNHVIKHLDEDTDARISLIVAYLRLLFAAPRCSILVPHLDDDVGPLRVETGGRQSSPYDHYRLRAREIEIQVANSPECGPSVLALKLTYHLDHLSDDSDHSVDFSAILDDAGPRPLTFEETNAKFDITINRLRKLLIYSPTPTASEGSIEWCIALLLTDNVYALLHAFLRASSIGCDKFISLLNDKELNSVLAHARQYHQEHFLNEALKVSFDSMETLWNFPIDKINDDILLDLCRWYTIGREAEMGSPDIRIPAFESPAILFAMDHSAVSHREMWHNILRGIDDVISQDSRGQNIFGNLEHDSKHPYAAGFKLLKEMKKAVGFVSAPQDTTQTGQTGPPVPVASTES